MNAISGIDQLDPKATQIEAPSLPSAVAQQEFREAMSQLAAAVHIVTTTGASGPVGFTASAVCSVSDSPPSVLVCINRQSSCYASFQAAQVLAINTLATQHCALSQVFAGKTTMAQRFAQGTWQDGITGVPVLADALVSFECHITARSMVGSHEVLICQVLRIIQQHPGSALLYYQRAYHQLQQYQTINQAQ
jgi:flavin reductase